MSMTFEEMHKHFRKGVEYAKEYDMVNPCPNARDEYSDDPEVRVHFWGGMCGYVLENRKRKGCH